MPAHRQPAPSSVVRACGAALVLAASALAPGIRACCLPRLVTHHRWPSAAPGNVGFTLAQPVTDLAGGVYTVQNAADGTLVLVASRDDGGSFRETPVPASGVRTASATALAVSPAGDVLVAWVDLDDRSLRVAMSHDQGRTFDPPAVLANEPVLALGTVQAATTPGGFVLTWQRGVSPTALGQELLASSSQDQGRTWAPAQRLDDSGVGLFGAAAIASSGLEVVASWLEGDPSMVMADHSADGGLTWSSDRALGRAVLGRPTLVGATGSGAFVVVTAQDGLTGALQSSASLDGGANWMGGGSVAPASALAAMAALPDGRVVVVFTAEGATRGFYDTWMAVSFDRGLPGSWAPPELLIGGVERTDDLRMGRGADGKPWLVQVDYRDAPACPSPWPCESVYIGPGCKVLAEGLPPTFQVDLDEPPYLSHSEDGRIALSASGRVHVFWMDFGDVSVAELRHACFDPPGVVAPVDFELPGLLLASKDAGDVTLLWTDSRPEASHYDVLEGTIDALFLGRAYDHRGAPCAHPRSAPLAPSTSLRKPLPVAGTYWLVAPATCEGTGPAGFDSFGRLTPPVGAGAGSACGPP